MRGQFYTSRNQNTLRRRSAFSVNAITGRRVISGPAIWTDCAPTRRSGSKTSSVPRQLTALRPIRAGATEAMEGSGAATSRSGFSGSLAEEADEAFARFCLSGIPLASGDVERKTFSIAVHYRRVAEKDVEKIEDIIDEIVGRQHKLSKRRGKKVFEIHPRADWDKGSAVEWLLAHTRLGENNALALYLGDDLTDEDAFGALSGTGVCFAVRGDRRTTLADYALENTDDVRRFVDWLGEQKAEER